MEESLLIAFNNMVQKAYECTSFMDFLKLAITSLHNLVMYDSGMFYCAISRDSSFFQPYISGNIDGYYKKERFTERQYYLEYGFAGSEAVVYKASDYQKGTVTVPEEPRSGFLSEQECFHVACVRVIYRGQFLGEIYLQRSKDKPDFDERDMFMLRLLQPHISNVFHLIHTFNAVVLLETDKKGLDKKGLCLFDKDLNLTAGNVAGLAMLNGVTVFGSSVLYHLKEAISDMRDDASSKNASCMSSETFIKTAGGELYSEIIMKTKGYSKSDSYFYVVLYPLDENRVISEYRFKFTKRESEIIDGIIQGKSNQQISDMLNLSMNTVKTHLQRIFNKTGVSSRNELAYLLMLDRNQNKIKQQ